MNLASTTLLLAALLMSCSASNQEQRQVSTCEECSLAPQDKSKPSPPARAITDFLPADSASPEHVVLRGATIWPVTGALGDAPFQGDIVLRGGFIAGVKRGPLSAEELPRDATIIDASNKHITPGIIDTHSHLGVYATPYADAHSDGNEMTMPVTADVDARHSVWPQDPGFQRALAGGVTALQILPGSGNLIGGRAITLQLKPGLSTTAMTFPNAPQGVKMACGENPKRVYGRRNTKPSTRMGNMAVWRQTFAKAAEQREAQDRFVAMHKSWSEAKGAAKDEPRPPARDLVLETLGGVLRGELLLHVHCYRADEMVQVLELAEEFGFSVRSFHHATEAYKVRHVLKERDIGASIWADWWGFKLEAHDAIPQSAALVHTAGARAIIHSDDAIGIQRLNQEAAKAYWAGKHAGLELTEMDAISWITINPAWALGIDKVTGSIELGKRADLVMWSAHPLSVYARAELVFVQGERQWDRERDERAEPTSDFLLGNEPATEVRP